MPRRLTPKGARRRRDLVEFAGHAFAADGYHATSVSDIVDGLGVGKGVFYWYFKSKDELLTEILAGSLRSLRLAQRDAIAGEHDPARRIEQGIRASLRWQSEHRHLFILMEFARTELRFAPIIRQGDQQTVADALPHVSAGITAGLLRGEDPVVLTEAILGVTAHLARVLVLEGDEDPDEVAAAAIAFCRSGYVMSDNVESTRRIA
ncbi:MAG TPA: TetR/AcrR family transcriptional regulator [Acidimicrobiales bacterium]|jgi:AcrR family transcriptional regulator|nr:TetR/AcrR family transcriptional regulator [Acidimicrobiales bacterium]